MAQIDKPSLHFNTKLYSGNGSTQNITGVGFQPDLVWIKNRSDTRKHNLYDAVRGVTKRLVSNDTAAEDTASNGLTAFGTDGFTTGSEQDTNHNGNNFVSWNWKAAGTSGSANTNGTINSTVSVNTTAGFSIVTYTGNGVSGATVGHGLSTTAPKIVLIKKRSGADPWTMLNTNVDLQKYMRLDSTTAEVSDPMFNNTAPTTSVFTVDSDGQVNGNTNTFVAYCFSEVKGYSKFGTYTGNGNSDGQFVYTGFKPAWIMVKVTNDADNWHMIDNKRDSFNTMDSHLYANINNSEYTSSSYNFDMLSNGFKPRSTNNAFNASGKPYIYMAFAENPIVGSNDIPAVAR